MLEIAFTVHDLARTRFVHSPLWEVVASIQVLRRHRVSAVHQGWAGDSRARMVAAGLRVGLLFDLVQPGSWYVPDFLSPPPVSPLPDLDAELGRLRRVAPQLVRADLDVLGYAARHPIGSLSETGLRRRPRPARPRDLPSAAVAALYADPERGLDDLAGQIQAYWDLTIAPYWGRIRSILDGDLVYRGRRLGQGGHSGLFEDLARNVRWRDGSLHIRHRRFNGFRQLAGEGLLLVPSAFVWPDVVSSTIPPWQPSLTYPARGVATLWEAGSAPAPAGLARVIGRSRADLLARLDEPASTAALADRTGMTAGGVSQHLSALRAAGLVTRHRSGRMVLYSRTAAAETLLGSAGAQGP